MRTAFPKNQRMRSVKDGKGVLLPHSKSKRDGATMNKPLEIHSGWRLFLHEKRELPERFAFPAAGIPAQVPGTVHTDLQAAGLIPDPFYDQNEEAVQWVARNDWRYETVFDMPDGWLGEDKLFLVFEGLDTVADIFLNDILLGRAENMFRSYRYEVRAHLRRGKNVLRVVFTAPETAARQRTVALHQMPSAIFPQRVFLRKAQYSFGWDWGPSLPTMGIWRPVYLRAQSAGIEHLSFDVLALTSREAELQIGCNFWGTLDGTEQAEYELVHGKEVITGHLTVQGTQATGTVRVQRPQLWWPNGQGKPTLHVLTIRLKNALGQVTDELTKKVGIRTVELVTQEDGRDTFYFKINGRKVFVKGANWIPSDSFLPRVREETYRRLLTLARDAHMNLLRVWGGGIYEDERFYALCDELGLMVWQDFMFACAAYPQDEPFLSEVRAEAEENVARLRHHPSVVLWCGNNENEWIWTRETDAPLAEMPGYRLYHREFPAWLKQLDPFRPYWPGTPWGEESDPNGSAKGNRHVWEIWSWWQDYQTVGNDQSLFVTEFGFQAPADVFTWQKYLSPQNLRVQGETFEAHNKQVEGPERLFRFLSAHLPVHCDFAAFVYLTQLNQAFALQSCLEHWRDNERTNGAIIWQLNDCWPVSSWSLIDYRLRPKLSYYQVRRSFAPLLARFRKTEAGVTLRVKSDAPGGFRGRAELVHWEVPHGVPETVMHVALNLRSGQFYDLFGGKEEGRAVLRIASVYDEDNALVARVVHAEKPWKYLSLPAAKGKMRWRLTEQAVELESSVPVLFVTLRHGKAVFADQGFVLLPGERKRVEILSGGEEMAAQEIETLCLNDFLTGERAEE